MTGLGIETRVFLPDWLDTRPGKDLTPKLLPTLLKMRTELLRAPRVLQCSEFCRSALEAVAQTRTSAASDAVIAHSDEGAMFIADEHPDLRAFVANSDDSLRGHVTGVAQAKQPDTVIYQAFAQADPLRPDHPGHRQSPVADT